MNYINAKQRVPCIKCLLSELPDASALKKSIDELILRIPEEKKASPDIYAVRLKLCGECDSLTDGTCRECGCYVELRAAKNDMDCPRKKW